MAIEFSAVLAQGSTAIVTGGVVAFATLGLGNGNLISQRLLSQASPGVCDAAVTCAASCDRPGSEGLPASGLRQRLTQPSGGEVISQGNWACINDRPLTVPWIQVRQGDRVWIGLQDFALSDQLGLNLLDTQQWQGQPVDWFPLDSASVLPLTLSTQLTHDRRYLNLDPLIRVGGWQVTLQENILRITTPPAHVQGWQLQTLNDGYRLELQLDHPALVTYDPNQTHQQWLWSGSLGSDVAQALTTHPLGQRLGLHLEELLPRLTDPQGQRQVLLQAQPPNGLMPTLRRQANPPRLIIEWQRRSFPAQSIAWAPGLTWEQRWLTLGQKNIPLVQMVLTPSGLTNLSLKPLVPSTNPLAQTQPITQLATQNKAILAINGGFFNRNNQMPLGAIQRDGAWLSGPILGRGVVAWTNDLNALQFQRLTLTEHLLTPNQTIPLTELNSGYVRAGMARYTAAWGNQYAPLIDGEILLTVVDDRIVQRQAMGTVAEAAQTPVAIPNPGYVLAARANATAAQQLPPGTAVQLQKSWVPDLQAYPQILGAGPLLVQGGRIVLNASQEGFSTAFQQQQALRSAVGRRANGSLLLVTIAQTPGGSLISLGEMAQLMQQLGAVDALNLDGGSSSSLYLGGKILNRPPATGARIHNGLGLVWSDTP